MRKFAFARLLLLPVITLLALFFGGCQGSGVESPNSPPVTRLANIPPDGFVSDNPRLTIYWVGDDPDGYVIGYRYSWTFRLNSGSPYEKKPYTTLLNITIDKSGGEKFALMTNASPGQLPAVYKYFATLPPEGIAPDSANRIDAGDSLDIEGARVWASNPSTVRFPVHVNPNSGVFIFDSQDTLNPHTFEIAAIDNNGALDDEPAFLNFSTPQVPSPRSEVIEGPTDTVLVRLDATASFFGLRFKFRGFDPNSRTIDYSWVVDKNVWASVPGRTIPWSEFSQVDVAFITASAFPPESIYATKHTLYLRARNEFGSIDTVGYFVVDGDTTFSRRDFNTLYPEFLKPSFVPRTLLLNASFNYQDSVGSIYPNRDTLDNYYRGIMDELGRSGQYDIVHTSTSPIYFPGRGILGKYSTVLFYGDVIKQAAEVTLQPAGSAVMWDYADIGGKLVITAYCMRSEYPEAFMEHVPHCQDMTRRATIAYAFIGGTGDKGYPDVSLDYNKIDTSWHNPGYPLGLRFMLGGRPSGFGEIIYRWRDNGAPGGNFDGRTIGVRYQGLTYQVVYFGIPLYYCERPTAVQMLTKAFQDIGY